MSRPVLLIAGGSRGIGAATAKLAAGHGYDVAVNYKTNSNAAAAVVDAVKKAGGKAVAIQGDMALENDIERVFDTANDTFGSLTHFVHSSGIIGEGSRLDEVSAKTIREVLDIDTFGALLCLRACVRRMSTKHGGKGGAVVMLSSIPLYGGLWMMACVSQTLDPKSLSGREVDRRIAQRRLPDLKYYNGDMHRAALALPNFVRGLVS